MEKFLEINALSLAVFGASIFGIMKWAVSKITRGIQQDRDEREVINAALVAILHNKIYKNGLDYIDKGCISIGELTDLEKLYAPYLAMGGNSVAQSIMQRVKTLPIKKDGLEEKLKMGG